MTASDKAVARLNYPSGLGTYRKTASFREDTIILTSSLLNQHLAPLAPPGMRDAWAAVADRNISPDGTELDTIAATASDRATV